jgi:hypothetical protein
MENLTIEERNAHRAASEAFTLIRQLARGPITKESQTIIHDLADAFHNIPEFFAGPFEQRSANAFLLKSGIEQAQMAYRHHGLKSQHLPPLPIKVEDIAPATQQKADLIQQYGNLPARLFTKLFKPTDKQ